MYNSLLFCEFQLERENFSKNVFFQVSWKKVMIILFFFSTEFKFYSVLALLLCTCCPGNIGPAKIFEYGNIAIIILICDVRG